MTPSAHLWPHHHTPQERGFHLVLVPEEGEAPSEALVGATVFGIGTGADGLGDVCFILSLCDFYGLRILPGRETAEPTWPRAVLWLMASNGRTTTDLGVGRLELGSG